MLIGRTLSSVKMKKKKFAGFVVVSSLIRMERTPWLCSGSLATSRFWRNS
jgi:hypothetical protein